jgi:hypothetical protein
MNIRRYFSCVLITMVLSCGAVTHSQDSMQQFNFQKVGEVIDAMRSGNGPDLSISFDDTTFTIRKSVRTEVSSSVGTALVKTAAKQDLPEFRLAQGKFFLVWKVNENTWIEQQQTKDPARASWFQRSLETVATYPKEAWQPFMVFAMNEQ